MNVVFWFGFKDSGFEKTGPTGYSTKKPPGPERDSGPAVPMKSAILLSSIWLL
jgi:hypothetical protein